MATPQEIATASACLGACVPDKLGALLYLFDQIRINGGGAAMTPQEIATNSVCYGTCIEDKMGALLYLANAIVVNGGGGGGSSGITCSSASDPSGIPTGGCGIWVRLDVGKIWVYNSGSGVWDLYLG